MQALAQVFKVIAINRKQSTKHHWFRIVISVECLGCRIDRCRYRFTTASLANVFDASNEIAHLAWPKFGNRRRHRHSRTNFDHFMRGFGLHKQQLAATIHSTIHHSNTRDHAAIRVVLRIKNQCLQRRIDITLWWRNANNDFVQQFGHANTSLCRDTQDIFGRNT